MTKNKKNTILFQEDWYNLMKSFSDESFGKVLRAIMEQCFQGKEVDINQFDPFQQMALNFILPKVNDAREKYEQVCEKRKKAIQERWGKKQKGTDTSVASNKEENTNASSTIQEDTKNTNVSSSIQKIQKDTDNENGNDNDNGSTIVDSNINISVSSNEDTPPTGVGDDDPLAFENVWKSYGRKGTKSVAKSRYEKLTKRKKEAIVKYIPYYLAFKEPQFRKGFEVFISREQWVNVLQDPNGKEIPYLDDKGKALYHVADLEKFKEWFNRLIRGSSIPEVSAVTPDRLVNLNYCYTLYPKEMTKAMKVILHNERYIEMANKGMITFDYIFNPKNIIKICEQGGNN